MSSYGITGATGQLGRLVVAELLRRGVPAGEIVAVVRNPAGAADLAGQGVDVRRADYSEPDTLPAALAGVRRLLLISGNEPGRRLPQHAAVIDAATAAGVQRIAYTSILRADTSANPLAPEHKATEELLRRAGIPWTVLRNGWYTENYTDQLDRYLSTGEIVGAAGTGRISGAARADYAAAAAAVLATDGHDGTVYELGGPAFTLKDLAATVTAVTGTTVVYRDLPVEEFASTLRGVGLDAATAGFVAALDVSVARGELETDEGVLTRLIGRPATPLAEVVRAAVG